CSRSSYSRAIGRIIWSATWCTICRVFLMPSDSSKSIMSSPLKIRLPHLEAHLHDGEAVDGREAARVAEPELDRMLADVAVPAEHLHRVVGDRERGLGHVVLQQRRLAGRGLARVELPRRLPGEEPHGIDLARRVGELER